MNWFYERKIIVCMKGSIWLDSFMRYCRILKSIRKDCFYILHWIVCIHKNCVLCRKLTVLQYLSPCQWDWTDLSQRSAYLLQLMPEFWSQGYKIQNLDTVSKVLYLETWLIFQLFQNFADWERVPEAKQNYDAKISIGLCLLHPLDRSQVELRLG